MNTQAFFAAYQESRNGADSMTRHPLVRSFLMSNGVIECADAGCWWLMDILATELPRAIRKADESLVSVHVKVTKSVARITASGYADKLLPWSRAGINTDMPNGEYTFLIADEGDHFVMILLTEY